MIGSFCFDYDEFSGEELEEFGGVGEGGLFVDVEAVAEEFCDLAGAAGCFELGPDVCGGFVELVDHSVVGGDDYGVAVDGAPGGVFASFVECVKCCHCR